MQTNKSLSPIIKLLIAILICELTGILSGFIGNASMNPWFENLNKPSWNPPGFIFAPVWTILYLLMGISLWKIWKSNAVENYKKNAEIIFACQLFLNFWWSIVFFRFHQPGFAFFIIILMMLFILLTIFKFSAISKTAAWLLVPYISWVCFAAILNFNLWSMNS